MSAPPPEEPPADTAEGSTVDGTRSTVDWSALPDPVRLRLAAFAATASAELPAIDLPPPVRPVARFAPSKRARSAAPVLVAALRDFPGFRAAVAGWHREHRPDELTGEDVDAVTSAAAAVLLGDPSAGEKVAAIGRRTEEARLRSERDAALARADRLAAEVRRLQGELEEAGTALRQAGAAGAAEAERLRSRLREQGVQLRAARDAAARAAGGSAAELEELRQALAAAGAETDRERERTTAARRHAARAAADAESARHAAREARQADEVRLALLIDTVAGAVTGLRRELALGPEGGTGGPRPADLVRGAGPASAVAGRAADVGSLDRLLGLPSVHLVVDGYNVTKTGYPELTLSAQRDRLGAALSALAARTGAEVTVVFDGAAVGSVPSAPTRGVRVLFSDPGVLADDVITSIAAAEPDGRPVVVVTSDRAVADAVRRAGAHPVPSAVLLTRLGRV